MKSICDRLLKSIERNVDYQDVVNDKFINVAKKIDDYKHINSPVLIDDTSKRPNQLLNIFALLELINVASSDIRIYADKINRSTYADSLVVQALRGWLVEFPHRNLNILLRENDSNAEQFYKQLTKGNIGIDKQISIRFLTKNLENQFNCTIIDTYAYKIRLNDGKNQILLNFNDEAEFAIKMVAIFNKNWKKSSEFICGYQRKSTLYYLASLGWIDDWLYGVNIPSASLKLTNIKSKIPDIGHLETLRVS